jgi:hypothetical protein
LIATLALCLPQALKQNESKKKAYLGCSLPIKDKSMKQLRTRHGHKQPAAKPPGPLIQIPLLIEDIKEKFQAARAGVDRHCETKLILRADAQRETGQTGSDGRGEARS